MRLAALLLAAAAGTAAAGPSVRTQVIISDGLSDALVVTCDPHERAGRELLPCLGDELIGAGLGLLGAQVVDVTLISRPEPAPTMLTFGGRF